MLIDVSIFLLNFGLCASYVIIIGDNLGVSANVPNPLTTTINTFSQAHNPLTFMDPRMSPSVHSPGLLFVLTIRPNDTTWESPPLAYLLC